MFVCKTVNLRGLCTSVFFICSWIGFTKICYILNICINTISASFIFYVQQGNVPALTAQFESDTTSWPETVVMCVHVCTLCIISCVLLLIIFSRSSPLPDNSGFIENSHMGMTVHMNVLLPIDMWDFDQKKSEVFVCFGHKKLGQWDPVKKLDFIR